MGLYEEDVIPFPWQGDHKDDEKYAAFVSEYKDERLLKTFESYHPGNAVACRKHEIVRKEILKRLGKARIPPKAVFHYSDVREDEHGFPLEPPDEEPKYKNEMEGLNEVIPEPPAEEPHPMDADRPGFDDPRECPAEHVCSPSCAHDEEPDHLSTSEVVAILKPPGEALLREALVDDLLETSDHPDDLNDDYDGDCWGEREPKEDE